MQGCYVLLTELQYKRIRGRFIIPATLVQTGVTARHTSPPPLLYEETPKPHGAWRRRHFLERVEVGFGGDSKPNFDGF